MGFLGWDAANTGKRKGIIEILKRKKKKVKFGVISVEFSQNIWDEYQNTTEKKKVSYFSEKKIETRICKCEQIYRYKQTWIKRVNNTLEINSRYENSTFLLFMWNVIH